MTERELNFTKSFAFIISGTAQNCLGTTNNNINKSTNLSPKKRQLKYPLMDKEKTREQSIKALASKNKDNISF